MGNNCEYLPLTVWEVASALALEHKCSLTLHQSKSLSGLPKVVKTGSHRWSEVIYAMVLTPTEVQMPCV